ncbi:DUF1700 domain-containing protein [Brotaphodocola sp.]|uniref:DUF1700 domain-containing protein n=1 Tax=Brotaphodocola sp. TaxID=3073577 RepID=UPI003D7C8651
MTRREFLKQLEYLLQDIPDEEREEAIAYYRDYLEEAGDDGEEEALREFGSPERVAAIIRSDLNGNLEDGGSFTESGYEDERFRDPNTQMTERKDLPDAIDVEWTEHQGEERQDAGSEAYDNMRFHDFSDLNEDKETGAEDSVSPKERRQRFLKVGILIAILAVLSPMILEIGNVFWRVVFAAVMSVLVVLIGVGILTASVFVGAVICFVGGIGTGFFHLGAGMLIVGTGIFLLGLGLIGFVVSWLMYMRFLPWCLRGFVNVVSRFLHREGRRVSR